MAKEIYLKFQKAYEYSAELQGRLRDCVREVGRATSDKFAIELKLKELNKVFSEKIIISQEQKITIREHKKTLDVINSALKHAEEMQQINIDQKAVNSEALQHYSTELETIRIQCSAAAVNNAPHNEDLINECVKKEAIKRYELEKAEREVARLQGLTQHYTQEKVIMINKIKNTEKSISSLEQELDEILDDKDTSPDKLLDVEEKILLAQMFEKGARGLFEANKTTLVTLVKSGEICITDSVTKGQAEFIASIIKDNHLVAPITFAEYVNPAVKSIIDAACKLTQTEQDTVLGECGGALYGYEHLVHMLFDKVVAPEHHAGVGVLVIDSGNLVFSAGGDVIAPVGHGAHNNSVDIVASGLDGLS